MKIKLKKGTGRIKLTSLITVNSRFFTDFYFSFIYNILSFKTVTSAPSALPHSGIVGTIYAVPVEIGAAQVISLL